MNSSMLRAGCWLILIVTIKSRSEPLVLLAAEPSLKPRVTFNRDIRPILSDKCFTCHGPDSAKRQAELRLDLRESAVKEREGSARAFSPGSSSTSEALRRVISSNPDEVMPPPKSGAKLSSREIELLRRWLDDGAVYQTHWSFIPPHAAIPPVTEQSTGVRSPVDLFIRTRLDQERMKVSPEADRPTLLRRAAFDLTGLPPSLEELDEFTSDSSPDAFEKQIDRLLASPRFGERMATVWLDAARYADTNGYQTDGPRFMWRYRDGVIDAFNRNQPFDEFTVYQLAGDLLPRDSAPVPSPPSSGERARVRGPSIEIASPVERDSTLPYHNAGAAAERTPHPNPLPSKARGEGTGQAMIADERLIASGFNRNHRGNAEGGIIPEEFRVEYVVDRVETTATVWLGLTIGCARCHDHKYDPISQREFYQLFDYFNRVPEPGKYIRNSNSMPYLPAPTTDQLAKLTELQNDATAAQHAWSAMAPQVRDGIARLSDEIRMDTTVFDWMEMKGLEARVPFDGNAEIQTMTHGTAQPSVSTKAGTWIDGHAKFAVGRIGQAAEFDGQRSFHAGDIGDFGEDESFAISLWVKPRGREAMTILARMDHDNASRGYELRIEPSGRVQALFSGRILDDLIRIETKQPLLVDQWSHVFVSYDGSSAARGVVMRVNGERSDVSVITDLLSNPILVKLPLIVGAGGSAKPFTGELNELRLYRGRLTDDAALALAAGDTINSIIARGLNDDSPKAHVAKLREFYLNLHASEAERRTRQLVLQTRSQYEKYLATIPTTMVMQDVPGLRETRILTRGEYNKPGEVVSAGVPAVIGPVEGRGLKVEGQHNPNSPHEPAPPTKDGLRSSPSTLDHQPPTRLDLAQWLVAPGHPLTARVTVNRFWQMLFGTGLVKTAEDFGVQGEQPSHPELLDWLAIEFGGSAERAAESDEPKAAGGVPLNASSQSGLHVPRFDIKRTLRLLITSATYRQLARVDEAAATRDPENRWLARGPRFRLTAEMIRDAALASSGLLVESLGGPSVKPYQPSGLWEELSAETVPGPFSIYVQDHGASLYRRSLYTFQKRTVTTPGLAIFDASSRDFCRVKLPRTNTPLQALNLMNDVTYLEAARVLAERAMREGGASNESRLTWAFCGVLTRTPNDEELKRLVEGHTRRLNRFRADPTSAANVLNIGEAPHAELHNPSETAALAATIGVILNLDEAANR